jgi:hypothetical protein
VKSNKEKNETVVVREIFLTVGAGNLSKKVLKISIFGGLKNKIHSLVDL